MNVDISHQMNSSRKPTLNWLSSTLSQCKKVKRMWLFLISVACGKSFRCGFSTGIRLMGNNPHSFLFFTGILALLYKITCISWKNTTDPTYMYIDNVDHAVLNGLVDYHVKFRLSCYIIQRNSFRVSNSTC